MEKTLTELAEILHNEECSCVISSCGKLTICRERGVKDLYRLLTETPEILASASLADKVVGKGAAALMVLGKVGEVYADVISGPALELLQRAGVQVEYGKVVPNIINRAGTGVCPVEALCKDAATAEDCFPLIEGFVGGFRLKAQGSR